MLIIVPIFERVQVLGRQLPICQNCLLLQNDGKGFQDVFIHQELSTKLSHISLGTVGCQAVHPCNYIKILLLRLPLGLPEGVLTVEQS